MRRAPSVLLQTRTRLACVKHAASVRSEPGSNSRLKLVAWRKKMLLDLHRRASLPSELLSLDLLRPFGLEKAEWFRTDSGTSYRLSKSLSSLSCRKACPQPKENTTSVPECQHHINDFHRNSQAGGGDSAKAFAGNELRGARVVDFANQCWIYFAIEIRLAAFAGRKKEIGCEAGNAKFEIRNWRAGGEFRSWAVRGWKQDDRKLLKRNSNAHRQECLCYLERCQTK